MVRVQCLHWALATPTPWPPSPSVHLPMYGASTVRLLIRGSALDPASACCTGVPGSTGVCMHPGQGRRDVLEGEEGGGGPAGGGLGWVGCSPSSFGVRPFENIPGQGSLPWSRLVWRRFESGPANPRPTAIDSSALYPGSNPSEHKLLTPPPPLTCGIQFQVDRGFCSWPQSATPGWALPGAVG